MQKGLDIHVRLWYTLGNEGGEDKTEDSTMHVVLEIAKTFLADAPGFEKPFNFEQWEQQCSDALLKAAILVRVFGESPIIHKKSLAIWGLGEEETSLNASEPVENEVVETTPPTPAPFDLNAIANGDFSTIIHPKLAL